MRPLAVAVTGGIGAGKSEALRAFARRGVPVLSSDEVVHRLLREDQEVRAALLARFGPEILGADGAPDRAVIAARVFGDPDELAWLERLLHPLVEREERAWGEELLARSDSPDVGVIEIPLLFEVGAEDRFDAVVVITAPEEVRAARTAVRPDSRADRLLPDDEKVRRADFTYVNDGTLEELDDFVGEVLARLRAR